MKTETLVCQKCNEAVSIPLSCDEVVRDTRDILRDDSVSIDRGQIWRVDYLDERRQPAILAWINPQDLIKTIVFDPETYGCCGYYGIGNTRCCCGHVIGDRIDECARMPRFEPNLKNTYWISGHD